MINVSQAGLTQGITICQKILCSPAPSILDASSNAVGTEFVINCRIRNTPKEPAKVGKSIAQYVSIIPNFATTIYLGIFVTSPLNNNIQTTNPVNIPLPGTFVLANGYAARHEIITDTLVPTTEINILFTKYLENGTHELSASFIAHL